MKQETSLYLVGGFLGSGKTTAIIQAAKHLIQQGYKVGVITNDQGKYLVDTAFFRLESIPAVEVGGGCFCCNYDDLNDHIKELINQLSPDIIFAESVGSCADIVATVIKPLLTLDRDIITPKSLSVFVDGRMLTLWLDGSPMPFSDDVVYIFEKQMEEAGLLVINKRDLLIDDEIRLIQEKFPSRFPDQPFIFQNSHDPADVKSWVKMLISSEAVLPMNSLEIDYARYSHGEMQMAWLDETIRFEVNRGSTKDVLIAIMQELLNGLKEQQVSIGHLKFVIRSEGVYSKLSLTTIETENWQDQVPEILDNQVEMLVNARVEATAEGLRNTVMAAINKAQKAFDFTFEESNIEFFHPGEPKPIHRFS